jgi:hypothetical protein
MKRGFVLAATLVVLVLASQALWAQAQPSQPSTPQAGQSASQSGAAPAAQSGQASAPQVKVGSTSAAKAQSPVPGSTAQNKSQKTSIGKGKTMAMTSQPSSFWTEEVDMDGDGKPEETDMLYDASRGVMYMAYDGTFTCKNGASANGSILQAVYAKGNSAGKPVGSGWYTVSLDEGKCGAQSAAEYGCKFDASQRPTECGVATLDEKTGELDVAVAKD